MVAILTLSPLTFSIFLDCIFSTGTPVNTSFNDLKNQMEFLGLESVNEYFNKFSTTLLQHTNDRSARQRRGCASSSQDTFGHFTFLMRAIMIRHAQAQTYRGTTPPTTLMSLPPKVNTIGFFCL
mgnify:CR=1 FL=1